MDIHFYITVYYLINNIDYLIHGVIRNFFSERMLFEIEIPWILDSLPSRYDLNLF